jgi:hypothetical protein
MCQLKEPRIVSHSRSRFRSDSALILHVFLNSVFFSDSVATAAAASRGDQQRSSGCSYPPEAVRITELFHRRLSRRQVWRVSANRRPVCGGDANSESDRTSSAPLLPRSSNRRRARGDGRRRWRGIAPSRSTMRWARQFINKSPHQLHLPDELQSADRGRSRRTDKRIDGRHPR